MFYGTQTLTIVQDKEGYLQMEPIKEKLDKGELRWEQKPRKAWKPFQVIK